MYKGNFTEGHIEGPGKLVKKGMRSQFEGNFIKGKKVEGKLSTEYGTYEGSFQNGLMHGKICKFTWLDGKAYDGPFEFGEMHGVGHITCKGGQTIRG